MNGLSDRQYEALIAAIKSDPYDRDYYEKATRNMRLGLAVRPDGVAAVEIPNSMRDWRRDPQKSIALVDCHQAACDAAWRKYWEVLSTQA